MEEVSGARCACEKKWLERENAALGSTSRMANEAPLVRVIDAKFVNRKAIITKKWKERLTEGKEEEESEFLLWFVLLLFFLLLFLLLLDTKIEVGIGIHAETRRDE